MNAANFTEEVLPLKHKIYRLAKRLVGIEVEAEDLTQDVLVKLWKKKEELKQLRSLEAFAMTVTKNLCLDKLKSRKELLELPACEPAGAYNPSQDAETSNYKALMNVIIAALPDQQKIIVQLREIEGYEFEEIAAVTGLSINNVRVITSRARKTIKEELCKKYDYGLKSH